jgi:hypothetical protein
VISQKKNIIPTYNRLSIYRSSKVIDVLKLIGTLQNVSYRHVIIFIYYIMNNIHISYQSDVSCVQDKPFFFLRRNCTNLRKMLRGYNPQTSPLVAPLP